MPNIPSVIHNTGPSAVDLRAYLITIHGELITAADEAFRQNGLTFDEAWRSLQSAIGSVQDALYYLEVFP